MLLLLAISCAAPDPVDDSKRPPLDTDTVDTGADTDTPTPPADCDPDPSVVFTRVEADQPWHENELRIQVELTAKATVAARCTLDSDPSEVHLAEATTAATRHQLRFSGLLADSTYTCAVAATCPETGAPAIPIAVTTGPAGHLDNPVSVWAAEGYTPTEYVLANVSNDCDWTYQNLVVFDRSGGVRWWYSTPSWVGPSIEFVYKGDDRFTWGGGWEANAAARPRSVNLYEGEDWDLGDALPDTNASQFHHDGKQLADGRWATLEEVPVSGDSGLFTGFQVRIVDQQADTVDATYNSQRAVDEGHLPSGRGDAWHANWVDQVDYGDHREIYVSLRNLSYIVAFDADSGDWIWTFGPGGDFTLVDPEGNLLDDGGYSSFQHGAQFDGRRLTLYDNGYVPGRSRVVSYDLDTTTMTATLVWEWTKPDWYETTLGSVDWMANGHMFIGAGHAECFSSNAGDRTTILEVDPDTDEKVWEMQYTTRSQMAYRADQTDACTLFANAKYCPAVGDRLSALAPLLGE